jgi:phospho-acceptor domain-containing protein
VTEAVRLEKHHAAKDRLAAAAFTEEHRRLVEAVTALEAANHELEAFSYSVAHDLRAPLRGIQGFSQALLEDYTGAVDTRGQDYLQRVSSAALRMSELIDDLLTLSRISRTPLSRGPVDLSAIATRVAGDLEREHHRAVKTTIAGGMQANADDRLMRIVFENLLDNAWKFTAKVPEPSVEIGSQSIDGDTASTFGTTAPASTKLTRRSCLRRFSAYTPTRNSPAPASGWPPCSASSTAMAAACGEKARSSAAPPSTSRSRANSGAPQWRTRSFFSSRTTPTTWR